MSLKYKTGDGRRFDTADLAISHANAYFRKHGIVISVVAYKARKVKA